MALQADRSAVSRILSGLFERGIVEKSESRIDSQNRLQRGLIAYQLTDAGRRYVALTVGLMETMHPFPIGVKQLLQVPELRIHFKKLDRWIQESLKQIEALRTGANHKSLAYSRQVLTVAEAHVQDSIEKTLNVGRSHEDSLRHVVDQRHETSEDELQLLQSGKVDIGLLTKAHVERMLARNQVFDLVLLDVIISGAPTFLSVHPSNKTQHIAYPEGSTQRRELALKLSKGLDPEPVSGQNQLLEGQLDGTYGKVITPIEPLLRLELGGTRKPQDNEQSHETYLLVARPSSLGKISLQKLLRDLDRFHGILLDQGQLYSTVSNYVTGPLLSELNDLLTKRSRPRITRDLEKLRPA